MSKFHNIPTKRNGIYYDSKLEAKVAGLLNALKRATKASERVIRLERQVQFPLEAFSPVSADHKEVIGTWTADFVVHFADGRTEVWECKSKPTKTRDYRRAIKILKANQPNIVIREITKDNLPR